MNRYNPKCLFSHISYAKFRQKGFFLLACSRDIVADHTENFENFTQSIPDDKQIKIMGFVSCLSGGSAMCGNSF